METKFQTSFIPRRPIPTAPGGPAPAARHSNRSGSSLFMTLSTVIFVLSILSIGGAYLWKQYLVSAQEQYKHDLTVREQQFNIELIRQLKAESTKIGLAQQLIRSHTAASKLLSILSGFTAENVRFTTLDFVSPSDQSSGYQISLSGYGKDLSTVAFQAKVLNKMGDYHLTTTVRNPIVANPTFNQNGTISFNLTASVDASALAYQSAVDAAAPAGAASPADTASASSTSR